MCLNIHFVEAVTQRKLLSVLLENNFKTIIVTLIMDITSYFNTSNVPFDEDEMKTHEFSCWVLILTGNPTCNPA
jgi:hypothetical protein